MALFILLLILMILWGKKIVMGRRFLLISVELLIIVRRFCAKIIGGTGHCHWRVVAIMAVSPCYDIEVRARMVYFFWVGRHIFFATTVWTHRRIPLLLFSFLLFLLSFCAGIAVGRSWSLLGFSLIFVSVLNESLSIFIISGCEEWVWRFIALREASIIGSWHDRGLWARFLLMTSCSLVFLYRCTVKRYSWKIVGQIAYTGPFLTNQVLYFIE